VIVMVLWWLFPCDVVVVDDVVDNWMTMLLYFLGSSLRFPSFAIEDSRVCP